MLRDSRASHTCGISLGARTRLLLCDLKHLTFDMVICKALHRPISDENGVTSGCVSRDVVLTTQCVLKDDCCEEKSIHLDVACV